MTYGMTRQKNPAIALDYTLGYFRRLNLYKIYYYLIDIYDATWLSNGYANSGTSEHTSSMTASINTTTVIFWPCLFLTFSTGPMRIRFVLFCQCGCARSVSQVHPEDQETWYHTHQRHGHYSTGSVADKRCQRLNSDEKIFYHDILHVLYCTRKK